MRTLRRRHGGGFALLEVILSMVILGISVATLMRSFQLSLSALKKNRVVTQATVLADQLLQDLELDPSGRTTASGTFEEQGYPQYSWSLRLTEEEPKYKGLRSSKNKVDMKTVRHAVIRITFDDGVSRRFTPLEVETYLLPLERWSYQSKFFNELFKEDAGKGRRR